MLMFLLHIIENLRIKFSFRTFLLIRAVSRLVKQKLSDQPFNTNDQATVIAYVYDQLPKKYKAPDGTVTQEELTAVIQSVISLYETTRLLTRK